MDAKKYIYAILSLVAAGFLALAVPALAANNNDANLMRGKGRFNGQIPGIFGMVTAVNGNMITVDQKKGNSTTTVSYAVDAANAKVTKNNATSTVSNIVVGDMVSVRGTVSGSNVAVTLIYDGQMPGLGRGKGLGNDQTPVITGNGQPIVAGTVTAVSGQTLAITNKSNVQYSIDASNAKITQGQNTIQFSEVKVGDSVVVQGTVNGAAIVASLIIDQTKAGQNKASDSVANAANEGKSQSHPGFFGSIGQFFMRLFGF